MIDKDQAPILRAMIKESYGPVLLRTICHFVLLDLNEIAQTMRIMSKQKLNVVDRLRIMDAQLQSDKVKHALRANLNARKRLRHAIVDEVINQYGLTLAHDEIDFYQDEMQNILKSHEMDVESWLMTGNYQIIRQKVNFPG